VHVIPLTGLTEADVLRHATDFLVALESPHWKELSYPELKVAHDTITAPLGWLWEAIALPVLPSLLAACAPGSPERPRVWWCPTGPLTFLPLHAPGAHNSDGDSVVDHLMSSYTLTLRLLLRARERPAKRSQPPQWSWHCLKPQASRHCPAPP
jgi:hypothetical protein